MEQRFNRWKLSTEEESPSQTSTNRVLISCKFSHKNHTASHRYSNWCLDRLASCAWKRANIRTIGDHFTIHSSGKLTSWTSSHKQGSVQAWNQLGLHPRLWEGIDGLPARPTQMQNLMIPAIEAGHNLLCIGETGSGKTLGFGLPIISRLLQARSAGKRVQAVVLAPTGELRRQIHSVLEPIGAALDLKISQDLNATSFLEDIFVSSPENILTRLEKGNLKSANLCMLVLDEADFLLDLRNKEIIQKLFRQIEIGKNIPNESQQCILIGCQILLVGATFPSNLSVLTDEIMESSTFQTINSPFAHRILPNISQKFIRTTSQLKPDLLISTLKKCLPSSKDASSWPSTLVFCNTIRQVNTVHQLLAANQIQHAVLHADLSKPTRQHNQSLIENSLVPCIVATDLASHGLHIPQLDTVVNFDWPNFIADYLHRIGRVGRVGSLRAGRVVNLISKAWEVESVWKIEESVRRSRKIDNIGGDLNQFLRSRIHNLEE